MEQIGFAANGQTVMTTAKQYDNLNRLTAIESGTGVAPVSISQYAYNSANQRTALTNADNSYWIYTYDDLGQVTSGRKHWANGTPVAGQQFDYTFDDIGNRKTAASGGNQFGSGLRQQTYTANNTNQYTSRTVPPYVDVLGTAASNATVTAWGDKVLPIVPSDPTNWVRTLRQGEYWRAEAPINNSTGAVWLTLTNLAVLNDGTNADIVSSVTGRVLVVKSPESFTHDFDGNLTSDGLWTNTWNGENRRSVIESRTSVPAAARFREQWTFLPDGRWIERIVSTNNGSAYYPAYTNRYVWDGQVLLAVLDHTNGLVMSFLRGLDLSGSLQGAGGVGGLLAVSFKTGGTHFAAFDGNGNVAALVSAADGTTSAQYEYGPFGETLRQTGPVAKENPIRFSTQYADDVTDALKYLYRDYNPVMGRWLNRDPIEERGGRNVYGFVYNDPVQNWDYLGMTVHLAPLNGEVVNRSSAYVTISGDWVEVDISAPGGWITKYPWSSWDYWWATHDRNFLRERERSASYTLAPGHSSPGDWSPVDAIYFGIGTAIVDADFITGSTKPVYDSIFCLFRQSLPIKIGPFRLAVKDCRCRNGVYVVND